MVLFSAVCVYSFTYTLFELPPRPHLPKRYLDTDCIEVVVNKWRDVIASKREDTDTVLVNAGLADHTQPNMDLETDYQLTRKYLQDLVSLMNSQNSSRRRNKYIL